MPRTVAQARSAVFSQASNGLRDVAGAEDRGHADCELAERDALRMAG